MPRRLFLSVVLSLILLPPTIGFASFTGPGVSVFDGDAIEVLHNTRPERIRLSGIDCLEKGQAYGNNAKHAASALVFGKEVTLQTQARTSTDAPLETCSCWVAPTSATRSSKTAGAGGIESMRQGIRYWKG